MLVVQVSFVCSDGQQFSGRLPDPSNWRYHILILDQKAGMVSCLTKGLSELQISHFRTAVGTVILYAH